MGIFRSALAALLVVCTGLLLGASQGTSEEKPNVVFVLTDDMATSDLRYMPQVRELAEEGASFDNAFVSQSLCCPSRATFLTGDYPHNHGVHTNSPDEGSETFRRNGSEKDTIATRLRGAGYETAMVGRYFPTYRNASHVPPGWDLWRASTSVEEASFGGEERKLPDTHDAWASQQAVDFIRDTDEPFYLHVGTSAPHRPHQIKERFEDSFQDVKPPRSPSYNEANVSDKPAYIRDKARLRPVQEDFIRENHRDRLQSLRTVNAMLYRIKHVLRKKGELDNTQIVFTSDNGWQNGSHRHIGKWLPYEESLRVPLVMSGPGVEQGSRDELVLNNDFAPTVAEWAGVSGEGMDGSSLTPLLRGESPKWRNKFLFESRYDDTFASSPPTYNGVRSINFKWLKYYEGPNPTGDIAGRELYALNRDPYELNSIHRTAPQNLRGTLERWRRQLENCSGDSCSDAEGFVSN